MTQTVLLCVLALVDPAQASLAQAGAVAMLLWPVALVMRVSLLPSPDTTALTTRCWWWARGRWASSWRKAERAGPAPRAGLPGVSGRALGA